MAKPEIFEEQEYWIEYIDNSKEPYLIFTIVEENNLINVIHNFKHNSPLTKDNHIKTSKYIMRERCRKLEIYEVIAFKMLGHI